MRVIGTLALLGFAFICSEGLGQPACLLPLQTVRLGDVTLHYVSVGRGEPVVMVQGGLEDYRAWTDQLAPLAIHYRAIAYSRRYNFPNRNGTRAAASYLAQVDADDLAMLIDKLHLGPVHVVGHSYGGLAALLFAAEHPELVRTLTLSEPPVLPWVEEQPGGDAFVQDFFRRCWTPVGRALARHERVKALAIATKYFTGDSNMPAAAGAASGIHRGIPRAGAAAHRRSYAALADALRGGLNRAVPEKPAGDCAQRDPRYVERKAAGLWRCLAEFPAQEQPDALNSPDLNREGCGGFKSFTYEELTKRGPD